MVHVGKNPKHLLVSKCYTLSLLLWSSKIVSRSTVNQENFINFLLKLNLITVQGLVLSGFSSISLILGT